MRRQGSSGLPGPRPPAPPTPAPSPPTPTPSAATSTGLRIGLATAQNLLTARDEQLDEWKQRAEDLRDQLVACQLALAGAQQALRAADAEKQLLAVRIQRLELASRDATEQHTANLQTDSEQRGRELGAARRQSSEQAAAHGSALSKLSDDCLAARQELGAERACTARLRQQAQEAQRELAGQAAEVGAAQAARLAAEQALADVQDDRAKIVLLRDERLGELEAQLAALSRAGTARSIGEQGELGSWIGRYNVLRAVADRQATELDCSQRAERRAAALQREAEQRLGEASAADARQQELVAALQAELRRQVAQSSAAEMEGRMQHAQLQRQQQAQARQAHDTLGRPGRRAEAALRRLEAERPGAQEVDGGPAPCAPAAAPHARITYQTLQGVTAALYGLPAHSREVLWPSAAGHPRSPTRACRSATGTPLKMAEARPGGARCGNSGQAARMVNGGCVCGRCSCRAAAVSAAPRTPFI